MSPALRWSGPASAFLPVTEQHDDDEKCEFPPELQLVVEQAQARAPQDAKKKATVIANPIRSIIPGLRERISFSAPVRKGAATDDVHHCPEQRRDPACAGEVGGRRNRAASRTWLRTRRPVWR